MIAHLIESTGEISNVCIKRKFRNRPQDAGQRIFVQSADRGDDGMRSLKERAEPVIGRAGRDADAFMREACAEWYDVRAFGQLFAFKSKGIDGVSMGIRGRSPSPGIQRDFSGYHEHADHQIRQLRDQ